MTGLGYGNTGPSGSSGVEDLNSFELGQLVAAAVAVAVVVVVVVAAAAAAMIVTEVGRRLCEWEEG